jgi:DNA-binding NarL/FixJ family response regulator
LVGRTVSDTLRYRNWSTLTPSPHLRKKPQGQAPGAGISVLIVDDSTSVRNALRQLFANTSDMQICAEAVDGVDAIKKAEKYKPDLVLMDVVMPNLNGLAAAAAIRHLQPKTRIVVFTMFEEIVGKSMARAAGVDLVLSKANDTQALVQRLQRLLEEPTQNPADGC